MVRKCHICGAVLSRYNDDNLCYPCQKTKNMKLGFESARKAKFELLSARPTTLFENRDFLKVRLKRNFKY